jgi:hypothetical protein
MGSMRVVLAAILLAPLAGCSTSAIPQPPQPSPAGLQFHVGPYTVAPGAELEECTTFHLDDEVLVDGIETWTSEKVHHFATTATISAVPEGSNPCSEVLTEQVMQTSQTVFSTTRTHHQVVFPPGYAGKVSAGYTNLVLSLHYVNASDQPAVAEAYLNLTTTTKDQVQTLVNGVVAHQRKFTLPPQSMTAPTGRCLVDRPVDVLAIGSHAHARLTELDIRFLHGGVRPDMPDYANLDWQTPLIDMFPQTPVHLDPGDGIEWTCNYTNATDAPIVEGPHTTDEMCTAVLVYAPDQGFLTCDTTPDQPTVTTIQTAPPGML